MDRSITKIHTLKRIYKGLIVDWIKEETAEVANGDQTTHGHIVYRIGHDGLEGTGPYYGEFTGHFLETTPIFRGQSLEDARHACETHNKVWSNKV